MNTRNNYFRHICLFSLLAAFVYGLVLPFCWGNNPLLPTGTLSLLCEDRKIFFWIWGILSAGSLFLNARYLYARFESKSKFLDALCYLSLISIVGVAATLGHDIDSWNPKRVMHWIATGAFVVFTIAYIALFFIINNKKHKRFKLMTFFTFFILATFLFMFLVIGKSGLMEIVPLAMLEIQMFVANFTPLLRQEDKTSQ